MPPTILNRIKAGPKFGNDLVFGILDWKGFLGNLAGNYATVTGTLAEVDTPYGTGIQVAAASSYVQFNWTSLAPLTTSPRTVICRVRLPAIDGAIECPISWGGAALDDMFYLSWNSADFYGGYYAGDVDSGGTPVASTWFTFAGTNLGTNGGANIVYENGLPVATGTNGGAAITTYSALNLFRRSNNTLLCKVDTIIKEVLVFNRVLAAGEILNLHNQMIGNA